MKPMKIKWHYTYSYLRAQNITNPLKGKRMITKNPYNGSMMHISLTKLIKSLNKWWNNETEHAKSC